MRLEWERVNRNEWMLLECSNGFPIERGSVSPFYDGYQWHCGGAAGVADTLEEARRQVEECAKIQYPKGKVARDRHERR